MKKYIFEMIITCDSSMYTMDHTKLIVSNQNEESIGALRFNAVMLLYVLANTLARLSLHLSPIG